MNEHTDPVDNANNPDRSGEESERRRLASPVQRVTDQETAAPDEQNIDRHRKPVIGIRLWRTFVRPRKWRNVSQVNWVEKATLLVAILVLIVTAKQVLIYSRQADLMEDSVNLTERSVIVNMGQLGIANRNIKLANDSLTESKRIAKKQEEFSLRSLDASIKQSQLDQRAWVAIEYTASAPVDVTDPQGKQVTITFSVKNTGRTPGIQMARRSLQAPVEIDQPQPTFEQFDEYFKKFRDDMTAERQRDLNKQLKDMPQILVPDFSKWIKEFEGQMRQRSQIQAGGVIAPQDTQPLFFDFSIVTIPFHQPHRQPQLIYTYIEVTYNDIFTKERHTTRLCLRTDEDGKPRICPTGNTMN